MYLCGCKWVDFKQGQCLTWITIGDVEHLYVMTRGGLKCMLKRHNVIWGHFNPCDACFKMIRW